MKTKLIFSMLLLFVGVSMQAQSIMDERFNDGTRKSWVSHGDRHLGMGACFHGNFFAIFLMVS